MSKEERRERDEMSGVGRREKGGGETKGGEMSKEERRGQERLEERR